MANQLDFSALNQLAYRGFREAEAHTPKSASAPPASASVGQTNAPRSTEERKAKSFTDITGERSYKTMYRVAHNFHERYNPPRLDDTYWDNVTNDMIQTSAAYGDDPFLMGLLGAIMEELEREYKRIEAERL